MDQVDVVCDQVEKLSLMLAVGWYDVLKKITQVLSRRTLDQCFESTVPVDPVDQVEHGSEKAVEVTAWQLEHLLGVVCPIPYLGN